MTKAELVEEIYQELGFSKRVSAEIVEKVLETLKETLARGEPIKISGFGRFVVRGEARAQGTEPLHGCGNPSRSAKSGHLPAESDAQGVPE